jgi:type I restriction enzyme S subunit
MTSKEKTVGIVNKLTSSLVPKLTFPGSRATDSWQRVTLGTMLTEHGLKSDRASEVHSVSLTRGIVSQIEHMGRNYAAANTSHYNLVRPYDVVYTRSPLAIYRLGIVKQHRGPNNAIISPLYGVFTPINRYIGYIIEAYFESPSRSIGYLDPLAQKGAKNTIQLSNERFLSGLIVLPTDEREQEKIAACLSSLDDLIAEQGRKVDSIKTHKKGLVQQLFPREGETQPRLRFPEFRNDGDWEYEELGSKTTKVGSGVTPTGGDKTYKQSGRPFVRSQNVGWGVLLLDDVAFIDDETHRSFIGTELQVLDVLLNITGASIGRSAIANGRIAGGNVNQHVCIIRVKSADLNPFYLNQYLISPRGQKQIDSFQAGGNRQGLNFAQIRSFSISLPPKVSEQQRIADCLTSLDNLITAETQKLDALKTHKKGLMQQLFPSPTDTD